VYAIDFVLENTTSKDVTSLDTMTFDFGPGNQVKLTQPACQGSFPIPAGSSKSIQTQVVVSSSGALSNFSFICPGRQVFGGASGKAPPTTTFTAAIPITVGGKTADGGTFAATGSATRGN
jgi:hypothetical protein